MYDSLSYTKFFIQQNNREWDEKKTVAFSYPINYTINEIILFLRYYNKQKNMQKVNSMQQNNTMSFQFIKTKFKKIKLPYSTIPTSDQPKKQKASTQYNIPFISMLIIFVLLLLYFFGHKISTPTQNLIQGYSLRKMIKNQAQNIMEIQKNQKLLEIVNNNENKNVQKIQIKSNKDQWQTLKILYDEEIYKRIQQKQNQQAKRRQPFEGNYFAQTYMSQQLKQTVKDTRYFDIHYFIEDDHTKNPQRLVNLAKKRSMAEAHEKRPLLNITRSKKQLDQITQKMMYPQNRKPEWPTWLIFQKHPKQYLDLPFFFYSLSENIENQDYLQAQFERYDRLYNIGQYGQQLPICFVASGRNDVQIIEKMYDTVRLQNYTNYRMVHIDDSSNDGTIEKVQQYLQKYPQMKDKATVLTMRYKRNALFNRNWANRRYCQQGDIILDMDADDWIIGKQVFQLVNSIYQAGNVYKGKRQQLWSAFFTYIVHQNIDGCCPYMLLFGQVDQRVTQQFKYRTEGDWRTTALRTYLYSLYDKINSKDDFVDKLITKQGENFPQGCDVFIETAMLEMSAPKNVRFIDEPVYFYTGYKYAGAPIKTKFPDTAYSVLSGQLLPPYYPLQSLNDRRQRRNYEFKPIQSKIDEKAQKVEQVIKYRQQLKKKIREMFQRDKKQYLQKEK